MGRREKDKEKERRRVIIGSGTSLQVLFTIYSCKSLIAPDGDRWIDDIGSQRGDWKEEVRCARVFEALLLSTIVRRRRRKIKGPPLWSHLPSSSSFQTGEGGEEEEEERVRSCTHRGRNFLAEKKKEEACIHRASTQSVASS